MYVLHEILLLLLGWLQKRPGLRNLLAVTVVLLSVCLIGELVSRLLSDAPVRFAVSGTVRLAGEPLDAGIIEFRQPAGIAGGTVGGAPIRAGRYSIPRDRGLTEAAYDVRIYSASLPQEQPGNASPANAPPGRGLPPGVERIPAEYGSETRQRVEVGRGRRNVFDFDIPARPAPPAVPPAGTRPGNRS